VESNPKWKGKVVYGDTDSVFVHLKGRTKAEAFEIGAQIAHEITRKSPVDVLLKMEKVYLPCVLVSKKRYVGNAFEDSSVGSTEVAHFDAKGIEVVRRDQCGATVKIQEKALRILFATKDLSLVKEYLYKQVSEL
jgi:DNA polymerase zeta